MKWYDYTEKRPEKSIMCDLSYVSTSASLDLLEPSNGGGGKEGAWHDAIAPREAMMRGVAATVKPTWRHAWGEARPLVVGP